MRREAAGSMSVHPDQATQLPSEGRTTLRPSSRGISLVELIVVILVFAGLSAAVFLSILLSNRSYFSSETYIQIQEEARRGLDAMVGELRSAGGAIAIAAGQLTFQLPLGYNLALPLCPANAVCWGAVDNSGVAQPGWGIRYQRVVNGTSQQLVRDILNGAGVVQAGSRVLANNVSQLTFASSGVPINTITIQLQVQQVSSQLGGGSMQAAPTPLVTRVRLRNP